MDVQQCEKKRMRYALNFQAGHDSSSHVATTSLLKVIKEIDLDCMMDSSFIVSAPRDAVLDQNFIVSVSLNTDYLRGRCTICRCIEAAWQSAL